MASQSCWISYDKDCDFPLQNLPYGIFHLKTENPKKARAATAIGNFVVDLSILEHEGVFAQTGLPKEAFSCVRNHF